MMRLMRIGGGGAGRPAAPSTRRCPIGRCHSPVHATVHSTVHSTVHPTVHSAPKMRAAQGLAVEDEPKR